MSDAKKIKIISINCGSSSIKFSVFEYRGGRRGYENIEKQRGLLELNRVLSCKIEEIGTEFGYFYVSGKNKSESKDLNFKDHGQALYYIVKKTGLFENGGIDINIAAHRFVHGGKYYRKPLAVSGGDIKKLSELNALAPLHNPLNLKGLEIIKEILPEALQVCVFDTAFHGSIPLYAKLYPIPIDYYFKYDIGKYGFHGISYSFISNIFKIAGKKFKRLIVCHLGNGASICAIKNGISIDTSMGYTPLEGLMMGTRSGNIDPALPFILKEKLDAAEGEVYDILNKKSGLLGISKKTYDFKELIKRKDKYSKLALKMYIYRIIKFIGQYAASLNGLDALVFTGGIGENSDVLRKEVCAGLSYLGVKIDEKKNESAAKYFQAYNPFGRIKVAGSIKQVGTGAVPVFAVHTDEEIQIAYEALNFVA